MEKEIFDYSKLKGKIKEICGTQANFAKKLGVSTVSLSAKLNNEVYFRQEEIQKSVVILKINDDEIHNYFFTKQVKKS